MNASYVLPKLVEFPATPHEAPLVERRRAARSVSKMSRTLAQPCEGLERVTCELFLQFMGFLTRSNSVRVRTELSARTNINLAILAGGLVKYLPREHNTGYRLDGQAEGWETPSSRREETSKSDALTIQSTSG